MTVDAMPAVGSSNHAEVASRTPARPEHVDPGRPPDPDRAPRPSGSPKGVLAVRELVARLRAAWPTVDEAVVEAAVRSAYASLREARIRAYVPILAERRARKVLGAAVGAPSPGHYHLDGERR
ncbi:three-helix bundle dimerization domain-containing protein [Streptomyces sp. NPDC005476]|uniref:three-helix bundle dimerization domain-containing protein n=1 Tax=Streptomyces sp. NPDC005476 TaxID=3156882 RepID=UPI0034563914